MGRFGRGRFGMGRFEMERFGGLGSRRGATHLGFLDVLTAIILLGILLFAATMQFKIYKQPVAAPARSGIAPASTPAS
jgi:hypothetical protein